MGTVILSETNELPTIKISELIEAGSFQDDDVLPGVTVGQTRKIKKINLMKDTILSSGAHIIYVAKNGDDGNTGTIGDPFLTIVAANNYAITLLNPVPDWEEAVVIKVAPGKYTEHFTNSHRRIYITGNTTDLENWRHDVIIYNTGADPAHYIFDLEIGLNLIGVTVQVDSGGIFGTLPNKTVCSVCQFRGNGHWIQDLTILDFTSYFNYCVFAGDAFKFEGLSDAEIGIFFRNCDIYNGTNTVFSSSGTGLKRIKLENTKIGNPMTFAGEWSLVAQYNEIYSDGTFIFDTDGYIDVSGSIITNGIHFVKDTIETKKFVNNYFRNITLGQTDITVDPGVTISIVDYSGNKQDNGLPAAFQIAGGGRNVGGFAENKYCSLQCAVESIPDNESGTIEIYENQTALDELVLNTGSKVTIKCGKQYDLEFTSDVVTLGANQELNLHEVAFMGGQKMEVNGDGALLSFEGCLTCQGYIVATSGVGSMVLSYFSSLVGFTGFPVISIDNEDTLIVSGYSRLKGTIGQPAVLFNVLTAGMFKVKYTTLIHGSGLGNRPIEAGFTTGKADVSLYNSAMNASLDTSRFNNLISSPNLTTSSEIDY